MAIFNTIYVGYSSKPVVEYEWWSPKMTSDNAPLPYAVKALSTLGGNSPYMAFDNNEDTFYHSSKTAGNQYLQFDFGEKKTIAGVSFRAAVHSASTYYKYGIPKLLQVDVSDDGTTWETVLDETEPLHSLPNDYDVQEHLFTPITHRYFRLICKKNYSEDVPSWNEENKQNWFHTSEVKFLRPKSEVTV